MVQSIYTAALDGINSYLVTVEVDIADGLPCIDMVGNLGNEVKESAERVRVALRNLGFILPSKRITINLSPAGIKKGGTAFDLPIAIGLLASIGEIILPEKLRFMAIGELGLDGTVRRINGVLPMALCGAEKGLDLCLVPSENAKEAGKIEGISIMPCACFEDVISIFKVNSDMILLAAANCKEQFDEEEISPSYDCDFANIIGQPMAKRAAEIAAAGYHNLLFSGPPGTGKSMIAKAISTILPPMSEKEKLDTSKIYSVAGLLNETTSYITSRPFQSPHHRITAAAFIGGGNIPKPGVISLANHGVLFLDEFPEFKRETLDLLRQPIEEGVIHISRKQGNYTYPSEFMLVAAMNPCPCGYYPDRNLCKCSEKEVNRYVKGISGPLLNRIDLSVPVLRNAYQEVREKRLEENSELIRNRVMKAFEIQKKRNGSYIYNSRIPVTELGQICVTDSSGEKLLEKYYNSKNLSLRAYHRMLRVSRTIADLDGEELISERHILEASNYRGMLDK